MAYSSPNQNITSILTVNYKTFTTIEKSIADFFLTNREEMDFSSKNMASHLYTSEASLTRFAQKCGFKGYRQFVYWYRMELKEEIHRSTEDVTRLTLDTYRELLEKSYSVFDEVRIQNVVRMISKKNKIIIYGKGYSGISAQELTLRLVSIGINAQCFTDSHLMVMNMPVIDKNTLVIGITVSGTTNDIFYALKRAKSQGADTVIISSVHKKQWDSYIDEFLIISTKEKLTLGKLISPQFPTLILFDVLYSNLIQSDKAINLEMPEIISAEIDSLAPKLKETNF